MMNFKMTDDTINVVILGKSGDGKTTLINAILGAEISETGAGFPVTQEIFSYKVPRSQLCLFDTKGFEVKDSQKTVDTVDQFINNNSIDNTTNGRVHCVWICVNAQSRWEPVHRRFVDLCTRLNIPCIVAVTQCYGEYEKFVEVITENVPRNVLVVPLLAKAIGLPDGSAIDPWGSDDLTEQTSSLGNSFKVQLAEKKARFERELSERRARLAREQSYRRVSSVVKKTIGGTISALGLLIVLGIFTTFEKCEDKPSVWSWWTNRIEHDALTARSERCSGRNSTRTGTLLIFLSGTAFVIWFTFVKDGD